MSTIGTSIELDQLDSRSHLEVQLGINGYARETGDELSTQVAVGRNFQLLESIKDVLKSSSLRVRVRLCEDGYICWLDLSDICSCCVIHNYQWKPQQLNRVQIKRRLPSVVEWVVKAAERSNKYLWGGTLGPDFDCSGLVQTAFASESIWLPRDAYQQERFCLTLPVEPTNYQHLQIGDLLFFGPEKKCTHVAIHSGEGFYWHSSGLENGRNGIGCDGLDFRDNNPIACHYRAQLRGAGRVDSCHNGSTLS